MKFSAMKPFFSVCIPTTNRGKTIYGTLCSLSNQRFRDFEAIVIDSGSTDNTRDEIKRFFSSQDFQNAPFPYIYRENSQKPVSIEDWNVPVKQAKGQYVAMLEGDDQFLPEHLEGAYNILKDEGNIGLYATGSQRKARNHIGRYTSNEWLNLAAMMDDVPPPSEAIFIRQDSKGRPFLYNDKDYQYSPEADLYMQIAAAGYGAHISERCDVYRSPGSSNWGINTWHYFADRFVVLDKYKTVITPDTYRKAIEFTTSRVVKRSITSKSLTNILNVSRNVIRKTSFANYVKVMIKIAFRHQFI